MIPTLVLDANSIHNNEQKAFALKKFIQENPFYELQDLYRWLYYGEFGSQDIPSYLDKERARLELMRIKEDIKSEKQKNLSEKIWEPMGLSQRFIMVFVTRYYEQFCPLMRLINLIERAPAFRGTRMQFKLDWAFLKEYIIRNSGRFTKQDFYGFEDRINFHQIPEVPFTDKFQKMRPEKYRVVPRKLFFDFFPEYDTKEDILPTKPRDSLID
jgi:hypothetical protein